MLFNLRLENETIAKLNYSLLNSKSILIYYPCDNQQNCTSYIADIPKGRYLFKVWGAEGGNFGGKGGYSEGILKLFDTFTKILFTCRS